MKHGKEPPLTGEITIKARTSLDDYTKTMIWLECTTTETYHHFEVPEACKYHQSQYHPRSISRSWKPIIILTMGQNYQLPPNELGVPKEPTKRDKIGRRMTRFSVLKDVLDLQSFNNILLRFIIEQIYNKNEVYAGTCDSHQTVPKLQMQRKRMGYYWP